MGIRHQRAVSLAVVMALAGLPAATPLCTSHCEESGAPAGHHHHAGDSGPHAAHAHMHMAQGGGQTAAQAGAHEHHSATAGRAGGVQALIQRAMTTDCCCHHGVVQAASLKAGRFEATPPSLSATVAPLSSTCSIPASLIAESAHGPPPGTRTVARTPFVLRI